MSGIRCAYDSLGRCQPGVRLIAGTALCTFHTPPDPITPVRRHDMPDGCEGCGGTVRYCDARQYVHNEACCEKCKHRAPVD